MCLRGSFLALALTLPQSLLLTSGTIFLFPPDSNNFIPRGVSGSFHIVFLKEPHGSLGEMVQRMLGLAIQLHAPGPKSPLRN